MITYNPAFDLYHTIFRMANILQRLDEDEKMEVDKVRIWDYYILFPSKVYDITIKRSEEEIRKIRSTYVRRTRNPYEYRGDNRKLFEWIKPVQLSALGCLVSCGILGKDDFEAGRVSVTSREKLDNFIAQTGGFSLGDKNVLAFLSYFSHHMSLTGISGLKARTGLLEFKYDAE